MDIITLNHQPLPASGGIPSNDGTRRGISAVFLLLAILTVLTLLTPPFFAPLEVINFGHLTGGLSWN
jgi:hypothetical protein